MEMTLNPAVAAELIEEVKGLARVPGERLQAAARTRGRGRQQVAAGERAQAGVLVGAGGEPNEWRRREIRGNIFLYGNFV